MRLARGRRSAHEAIQCEPSAADSAAWDDVMNVRMILERAAPGMEDAEEATPRRADVYLGSAARVLIAALDASNSAA